MATRHHRYIAIALAAAVLLMVGLLGAYLYLPRYVETRLIPELARTAGLTASSVRVVRIGMAGAELGPVQLDGPDGPAVRLERLLLSYSPATLLHRRIGRIRLEGLQATVRIAEGSLYIGDRLIAPSETAAGASRDASPALPAPPFRRLEAENAMLDIAWDAGRLQVPFTLTVDAPEAEQGRWAVEALLTPRRSRLRLSAAVAPAQDHLDIEVQELQASLPDWTDLIPADIAPPELTLSGRVSAHGTAAVQLNPWTVETAGADIRLEPFEAHWKPAGAPDQPVKARTGATISLTGGQTPNGFAARYSVELRELAVNRMQSTLVAPQWRLTGEAALNDALRADLRAESSAVSISHEAATLSIPHISVQASGRQSANGFTARGEAAIRSAGLIDSSRGVKLEAISVELPFEWPPPDAASAGRLTIDRIEMQKNVLGDLSGRLQQSGTGLGFELDHHSQLFPALVVHIKGSASGAEAAADIAVAEYRPAAPIDLGRFAPDAAGLMLGGRFKADGRLRWSPQATRTEANLRIDAGTLHDAERKLNITGIQAGVHLDDLLALHSPAGQRLRAERIDFGKIEATALEVAYRIAPPQRVLIERAGLDWCGGRLESGPIELNPDDPAVEAVLTARGLNLAMLLEQLELAEGSGQGTLRGRIPIRWAGGKLTFGKGSLASPPGESGVIRLKKMQGTQDLLAGLPAETPQHTQLDIAMEALKDYTYRSIDLQVESQEEIMVLRLQLAGKPNQLLPFGYDQELGRLKRIQGEGQAEFKGIDIDLNFRSPLNEILNYRDLLKTE